MLEFEAPDWRQLHSSLARRRRFAFCPVAYYLYHVPGRDGYADMPGSWRNELYCAKHELSSKGWVWEFFRRSLHKYYQPKAGFRHNKFADFLKEHFEYEFTLLENGEYEHDPKIVHRVTELYNNSMTPEDFYDLALLQLKQLLEHWLNTPLYNLLNKLPMLNFRLEPDGFCWQLGSVNFVTAPDLLWTAEGKFNVLDLNSYCSSEEQLRHGELFRAYIWRFMRIAPELVAVHNYDLQTQQYTLVGRSGEDFREVFLKLAGEAAMWRDYLLRQAEAAAQNNWLYARKENCRYCRFSAVCPANGAVIEE